ncbi:amidohydrolase [Caulobacter segnis]|uniref:amidohydrolase n=1 Tax=Caulobacter segnis TaxID=88688 RepID=UPI00240F3F19|nr:amidohydrolase [Caulobacter segnis]MDG2523015.1 amidohydrolase [Caulobacter segnis]
MIDRRRLMGAGALALASANSVAAWAAETGLDLALINGRVWTGRPGAPLSDAVGITAGRIAAIGAGAVGSLTTARTEVIDLAGAFVMPAFIDNHTHFLLASNMLAQPDLLSAKDRPEFVSRVGAAASRLKAGRWLHGGSWDEQRLGGALPDRHWIDAVTPQTPFVAPRTDLHMYLVNSLALRLAGITRDTPDPAGGVIDRDAKGEPTGILRDNAKALVERVIPAVTEAENEEAMRAGIAHGLSHGVAQVHVPEINWSVQDTLLRLRQRGGTDMRFYSFVPLQDWEKMAAFVDSHGRGDDWVRWGGVKGLSDGSLGSRTALFHEAYSDAPGQYGTRVMALDDLRGAVLAADKRGLQVTVHAIGDRANDDVLDVFDEAVRINGQRDRRFRIEHAQHVRPAAIPRFARQQVIASVQPFHAIDDGRWAVKRIGEARLNGTYAFGSFLKAGARMTFGSDWPVGPLDPITGIHAAVARQTLDDANPGGWLPNEKITVEQAMTAYTTANAHAGFQEDRLGQLTVGYLADIVVLDADPLSAPVDKLRKIKVLRTIVNGRQRYGA